MAITLFWGENESYIPCIPYKTYHISKFGEIVEMPCPTLFGGYVERLLNTRSLAIIGIKHDFPFLNIRKVPREVLKTEGKVRGFSISRGTLRMLMNDKTMFDRY